MRSASRPSAVVLAAVLASSVAACAARAADLTLVRATLSSSGVGQYDYEADVDGPGTLILEAPLSEVDDVLKSLRVTDPAGGAGVRLAGERPLAETFRSLPFSQEALAAPDTLLAALTGAEVRLPTSGLAGRIVGVQTETTALPDHGGEVVRHRLTVATSSGIDSAILEDAGAVDLLDGGLRAQLASALAAIAAHGARDRRQIEITLAGVGRRRVSVSDVVAAPVWKTSYRLTLDQGGSRARLEGDAIVENLTGRDWRNVSLTLTSGQPVLYRQRLYEALFTTRPEAPVDVPATVAPRVDAGPVPSPMTAAEPPPPLPPAPAPMQMRAKQAGVAASAFNARDESEAADAEQSATQVDFHLSPPVTAASGQTMLLPILARDVPATRVALYEPDADALHPLVALRLLNDTDYAWPAGLATLYGPDGYVGDARLPTVLPGETRLASFALDLEVRIDATHGSDQATVSAKATRGVLTLSRVERQTTTYRIAAPAKEGRTVLIEQPRRPGWEVAEPAAGEIEATPDQWRVSRAVAAGTTATLRIVTQHPVGQTIVLSGESSAQLAALASDGTLPTPAAAALRQVEALRADLDEKRAASKEADDKIEAIVIDQDRVRRNLSAVPPNSELQKTYLSQMTSQEKDLTTLRARQNDYRQQVVAAESRLSTGIAALNF